MKRKSHGKVLMAVGALLLAAAMGLTGYNLWDSARAESIAETMLVEVAHRLPAEAAEQFLPDTEPVEGVELPQLDVPMYMIFPEMEMPTREIDGDLYIGVLSIPTLELELPVMSQWSYPGLKVAPGRVYGSAYSDDLVICAHNYKRHFGLISQLVEGNEVIFTDMDGNEFRYEVGESEILQPTDVEDMLLSDWDLTLFTCTYGGRTRCTVRCQRLDDVL